MGSWAIVFVVAIAIGPDPMESISQDFDYSFFFFAFLRFFVYFLLYFVLYRIIRLVVVRAMRQCHQSLVTTVYASLRFRLGRRSRQK